MNESQNSAIALEKDSANSLASTNWEQRLQALEMENQALKQHLQNIEAEKQRQQEEAERQRLQDLETENQRLQAIEAENEQLKQTLKKFELQEEFLILRVTDKSQKNILFLAASAFALIGITTYAQFRSSIDGVKQQAIANLQSQMDSVLQETLKNSSSLRTDVAKIAAEEIINNPEELNKIRTILAEQLKPQVISAVDLQVSERLESAAEQVARSPSNSPQKLAQALQSTVAEEANYFVVGGTSQNQEALAAELTNVKQNNRALFNNNSMFSLAQVCLPTGDNQLYTLVLAQNLTLSQAREAVELATKAGFRPDTYLLRGDRATFQCLN